MSDFENKWQLSQKRWQRLGTFQKAHIGRGQRDRVIIKGYIGFKEEVASMTEGRISEKGVVEDKGEGKSLGALDYFHKPTQVI